MNHATYRPDIDGLRAVAVLAVLFNHAGFDVVSGGFVGVDVFFVISGYLITTILYSEVIENTFSVNTFYQRRIRRILPAFYLVSVVTVAAGSVLMLPVDFDKLVSSFIASSLFLANIFFMRATGGYFSDEAHEMPLLHMWSLSVEEQFYVFWPLLLLVLVKRTSPGGLLAVVAFLAAISFGYAEYELSGSPSIAYYSIASRAGELLLGSMLALVPTRSSHVTPKHTQVASVLGLLFVCGSIFLITEDTRFPGIHAIWPCLGTVLLIWAGRHQGSIGARLLSSRPMVFIGLISYSLYLWHWPILAFTRYARYEINLLVGLGCIIFSIFLAYLSWRYIEQPFRQKNPPRNLQLAKSAFTLFSFAAVIAALANHYNLASIQAFDEEKYQTAQSAVLFPSLRNGWCHVGSEDRFNKPFEQRYLNCQYGSVAANSKALLWGDSHAAGYAPFLDYLGKELGFSVVEMSTSACAPSLAPPSAQKWIFQAPVCNGFREEIIRGVRNNEYDIIFIAARWDGYSEILETSIKEAISFAAHHSKGTFVFSQVPRFKINIGDCYVRGKVLPLSNGCDGREIYEVMESISQSNQRLQLLVNGISNAQVIDVGKLICPNENCSPFIKSTPAYFDDNHLNIEGSSALARKYFASPPGRTFSENLQNFVM